MKEGEGGASGEDDSSKPARKLMTVGMNTNEFIVVVLVTVSPIACAHVVTATTLGTKLYLKSMCGVL